MDAREHDSSGVTIFTLGLLSVILCQALGPVAWLLGTQYLNRCEAEAASPNQLAVAGRVLGMVGTAFLGLVVLLLGVELIVVVLSVLAS